jgi:predicted AAA+ superfamily ATPase
LKIVISGSESLFIRRKTRETMAGRLFEFRVEPLSFPEYLGFRGLRYEPVGLHERELARAFDDFLLTQGFPELVGVDDKAVLRKYVHESVIDRVVFRDLPTLLDIRDVTSLRSLLNILMEEPGQLIRLSDLAGELGISRQTLSNYLTYFEESFLLRKLYNFSTGRRKVERKLKKYYPTVVSVDLLVKDDDLSRSKVLEWAVVNQLRAEFFWRDPYKNEVDVVLPGRKPTPIEVKYGKIDVAGMRAFMRRFGVGTGYVVTRRTEETRRENGRSIIAVPAHKFLLEGRPGGATRD